MASSVRRAGADSRRLEIRPPAAELYYPPIVRLTIQRSPGVGSLAERTLSWVAGCSILVAAVGLAGCGGGSGPAPGPIVFSGRTAAGGGQQLYVVNRDGTGLRRLTRAGGNAEPAWSPDGTRVAFKRWNEADCRRPRHDCARIWVVDADGMHERPLTSRFLRSEEPDWSPDGRSIVFVRWRDNQNPYATGTDVYVMRSDGTGVRRLTEQVGDAASPAWSPDGKLIVFTARRGGAFDIYVMRPDGGGIRQLTHTPMPDFSPAWSPDGARIAFQDTANEIVVMKTDGSDAQPLTRPLVGDGQPAWSPDGKEIVFVRRRVGTQELSVMRSDGSQARGLSITPAGEPADPDWALAPAAG